MLATFDDLLLRRLGPSGVVPLLRAEDDVEEGGDDLDEDAEEIVDPVAPLEQIDDFDEDDFDDDFDDDFEEELEEEDELATAEGDLADDEGDDFDDG